MCGAKSSLSSQGSRNKDRIAEHCIQYPVLHVDIFEDQIAWYQHCADVVMDPLSLSAGILAFLSAAHTLLVLLYKIQNQLTNPPWTLTTLVKHIKDLRSLVEGVQGAVSASDRQQQSDLKSARTDLYSAIKPLLADCMTEIDTLNRKLRLASSDSTNGTDSRLRNLVQAVKWTMSQKDVEGSLVKLERCKSALNLCISSQNL